MLTSRSAASVAIAAISPCRSSTGIRISDIRSATGAVVGRLHAGMTGRLEVFEKVVGRPRATTSRRFSSSLMSSSSTSVIAPWFCAQMSGQIAG